VLPIPPSTHERPVQAMYGIKNGHLLDWVRVHLRRSCLQKSTHAAYTALLSTLKNSQKNFSKPSL